MTTPFHRRPAARRATLAAGAALISLLAVPAAHAHHGDAPAESERPITAGTIYGQEGSSASATACIFGSATGTPRANGDTRYISFSSSVICNSGAIKIHHTRTALENLEGGALAGAPAVGPHQGDRLHTGGYYTRTHPGQLQRISTEFSLEIVDTGGSSIGWHVLPPMCRKLSRLKAYCGFKSAAFNYVLTTIPFGADPDVIEEDQDNFADDAPFAPTPDAETEAMWVGEGLGTTASGGDDDWRMPSDVCSAGLPCPSYTMTTETPMSDVPEWVRELPSFTDTVGADGTPEKTTIFWASDVSATFAATYADCPYRYACLWRHAGYRGYMVKFNRVGHFYDLGLYNLYREASSARNRGVSLSFCGDDVYSPLEWEWELPKRHQTPNMGRHNDRTTGVQIQQAPCD